MSRMKESIFTPDGTLSDYAIASGLTQSEPWDWDCPPNPSYQPPNPNDWEWSDAAQSIVRVPCHA